jgi:uncharacterized protein (TIGR03067 family)
VTFKLDPSKNPKQIDMKVVERSMDTFHGIYELAGDNLKLCCFETNVERPTKFATDPAQKGTQFLFVLKRQK